MNQLAPHDLYTESTSLLNGQRLTVVDKFFFYLGSTLSRSITIDEEVSYRMAKTSCAFGRFRDRVWNRRGSTCRPSSKYIGKLSFHP